MKLHSLYPNLQPASIAGKESPELSMQYLLATKQPSTPYKPDPKVKDTQLDKTSATPKPYKAPYQTKGDMRVLLILVGFLGLALMLVPYFLTINQQISTGTSRRMMFVGMVLWVLCALYWKRRNLDDQDFLN